MPPAKPVIAYDYKTGVLMRSAQPEPVSFKDVLDYAMAQTGKEGFLQWAQMNPGHFYTLAARALPLELRGKDGGPVEVTFVDPTKSVDRNDQTQTVERTAQPAAQPKEKLVNGKTG